jgi:hypothetical protein
MSEKIYWIQPVTGTSTSTEFIPSNSRKITSPGVNNTVGYANNGDAAVFGTDRTPYGKVLHHPIMWSFQGGDFTVAEPSLEERAIDPPYTAVTKSFRSVPNGNRWGIKCGTPGQRTFITTEKAWDPGAAGPTAQGFISGGPQGSDDFPRGAITVMFQEDKQLIEAYEFGFSVYRSELSGSSYTPPDYTNWTENLSLAVLNSSGNVVYEHAISGWAYPGANPTEDIDRMRYYSGDGESEFPMLHFGGPAYGFRLTHTNPEQADPNWYVLTTVTFATLAPEPPDETIYFEIDATNWVDSGDIDEQFYGKINWTIPDLEPYERGLIQVLVEIEGTWASKTDGAGLVCGYVNGRNLGISALGGGSFTDTAGSFRIFGDMDLYSGCDISCHSIIGSYSGSSTGGVWTITSAKYIIVFAEGVDISGLGKWLNVSDELVDTTDWGYV